MKYSVVIPFYNSEAYIKDTLDSLKNQTFKNVEIILINDGSTDNSEALVLDFIKENKNLDIKYKSIPNSGPGAARNVGIELAAGDYICFLDSDDTYNIHLFEELEKFDSTTDVIYFGWLEINEENKTVFKYDDEFTYLDDINGKEAALNKFKRTIWLCNCNEVYRLSMLKDNNIRYIEGVFAGEDANFIYKALLNAKNVKALKKNYFYNRVRDNSLMHNNFSNKHLTEFIALEDLVKYVDNQDQDIKDMVLSLQYYTRVTVSKRIVRDLKWYQGCKFRKMVKEFIPKYKKPKILTLNKKQKFEISIFNISKVGFFLFAKFYYKTHKK